MKTLRDAIGCWTATPEYNGLVELATRVTKTAKRCRAITVRNPPPMKLLDEMELLQGQLGAMQETTAVAIRRCQEIIANKETGK